MSWSSGSLIPYSLMSRTAEAPPFSSEAASSSSIRLSSITSISLVSLSRVISDCEVVNTRIRKVTASSPLQKMSDQIYELLQKNSTTSVTSFQDFLQEIYDLTKLTPLEINNFKRQIYPLLDKLAKRSPSHRNYDFKMQIGSLIDLLRLYREFSQAPIPSESPPLQYLTANHPHPFLIHSYVAVILLDQGKMLKMIVL